MIDDQFGCRGSRTEQHGGERTPRPSVPLGHVSAGFLHEANLDSRSAQRPGLLWRISERDGYRGIVIGARDRPRRRAAVSAGRLVACRTRSRRRWRSICRGARPIDRSTPWRPRETRPCRPVRRHQQSPLVVATLLECPSMPPPTVLTGAHVSECDDRARERCRSCGTRYARLVEVAGGTPSARRAWAQSTQHISVNHSVECLPREREVTGTRVDRPRPITETLASAALGEQWRVPPWARRSSPPSNPFSQRGTGQAIPAQPRYQEAVNPGLAPTRRRAGRPGRSSCIRWRPNHLR